MRLLEVSKLSKSFDDNKVIGDISFTVEPGQVLAVIGPSGSGKSTLLRCATMLEQVDAGAIYYKGEPMVTTGTDGQTCYAPPAQLKKIRGYFGLVFQNFNLFPHFSVLRNITEAPVHVAGQDKKQAQDTALRLLDQMGIADKAQAYPWQLSGGQQQRVSIARALALNPDILFFDEPTSALDPELTGEILKVIRDLAAQRMTMVIVTHEMAFARDVADYVLFMDGGMVVERGPAEQVINNPRQERTRLFLNRFNGS